MAFEPKSRKNSMKSNILEILNRSQVTGTSIGKEDILGENLQKRYSDILLMKKLLNHESQYHQGERCDQEFFIWYYRHQFLKYSRLNYQEYQLGHGLKHCLWNMYHQTTDCITAQVQFIIFRLAQCLFNCQSKNSKLKEDMKLIMVKKALEQASCSSNEVIEDILNQLSSIEDANKIESIIKKNIRQLLMKELYYIVSTRETLPTVGYSHEIQNRSEELAGLFQEHFESKASEQSYYQ